MFTEFMDHSRPIVETPDMLAFTEQTPTIFGDTWEHLCNLRGVNAIQKEQKERNIRQIHLVFHEIPAMARIATVESDQVYPPGV